jgi:DNA-binding transcriptional regulator YdaS (Cro superfamily)
MGKTAPYPVDIVIEKCGGPAALGRVLGITGQAVSQWAQIPPKHIGALSRLTGVPPHKLRPDLFSAPPLRESA